MRRLTSRTTIPFTPVLAVALTLLLSACGTSRVETVTATDHTFVDVTYDSTNFAMQVRKDTIDRNDNNVMFWGVNPIFAPKHNPAMQSLYFSLESNYRDERNREYMEWNFDSRGTVGQKHRLIHSMMPKDNGFGQLLELRWNHYLFKKAYGDIAYLSIRQDGMTINTPVIKGSQEIAVIGNKVMLDWKDTDIFSVELPRPGARGFDERKPVTIDFNGKRANQTVTVYLFTGDTAQRIAWPDGHDGASMYWKDGTPVLQVPANTIAEFTFSRIRRAGDEHVYLAALKGMYRRP